MEYKKLNECCISIADGDHLPPPKADAGVPFITISNVDSNNHIDFSNAMSVPESYYDSLDDKRRAHKGDILYSVVGSFGIPVLITDEEKFVFQRHIAILRPDRKVILPEYLYYVMKSNAFYCMADAYAVGAAQRTISLTSLRNMKIAVPSISVQEKVVAPLSDIDRLIDDNNKRIKLLEQMAENLYKHSFSSEKVEGCSEQRKLKEVISIIRGVSYSSEEIECEDGNALINLKNIQGFGGFRADGTKRYSGKYKKEQVVKTGDLVMGVTDMTQDRRTVGAVALLPILKETSVISADLIKIESDIDNIFLYSMFRFGKVSSYIAQFANGANVLHLRPQSIESIKVYIPPKDMIDRFVSVVKPMVEEINQLNEANENLIKQRDLLLPRLMSGKLKV